MLGSARARAAAACGLLLSFSRVMTDGSSLILFLASLNFSTSRFMSIVLKVVGRGSISADCGATRLGEGAGLGSESSIAASPCSRMIRLVSSERVSSMGAGPSLSSPFDELKAAGSECVLLSFPVPVRGTRDDRRPVDSSQAYDGTEVVLEEVTGKYWITVAYLKG